jgi:hypothetical protein
MRGEDIKGLSKDELNIIKKLNADNEFWCHWSNSALRYLEYPRKEDESGMFDIENICKEQTDEAKNIIVVYKMLYRKKLLFSEKIRIVEMIIKGSL